MSNDESEGMPARLSVPRGFRQANGLFPWRGRLARVFACGNAGETPARTKRSEALETTTPLRAWAAVGRAARPARGLQGALRARPLRRRVIRRFRRRDTRPRV